MTCRRVFHGNRDRNRYSVSQDSALADMSVIRVVLSLMMIVGFELVTASAREACV